MLAWTTPAEVANTIGLPTAEAVSVPTLAKAAAMIEVHTGLTQAKTNEGNTVSKRDLGWLKQAVAWQYAWLLEQPDIDGRMDVSAASQNGQNITPTRDGLVLAPMARRCIRRLAWRGTRNITISGGIDERRLIDPTISDAHPGWVPM